MCRRLSIDSMFVTLTLQQSSLCTEHFQKAMNFEYLIAVVLLRSPSPFLNVIEVSGSTDIYVDRHKNKNLKAFEYNQDNRSMFVCLLLCSNSIKTPFNYLELAKKRMPGIIPANWS